MDNDGTRVGDLLSRPSGEDVAAPQWFLPSQHSIAVQLSVVSVCVLRVEGAVWGLGGEVPRRLEKRR